MIRFFDIVLSVLILILFSPFIIIISILIFVESKGGIFYKQIRIGQFGKTFYLYKFRTMHINADQKGLLTIGNLDPRVSKIGFYLRKTKLDELPQFINVLKNEMSIVGPRPEVQKYVDLYSESQRKILLLKPGITDYTSILFKKENEMLAKQDNPEEYYKNVILPEKLKICLNTDYSLKNYFIYMIKTII